MIHGHVFILHVKTGDATTCTWTCIVKTVHSINLHVHVNS